MWRKSNITLITVKFVFRQNDIFFYLLFFGTRTENHFSVFKKNQENGKK